MLFTLYLAWAFVPEEFVRDYLGFTYWPSRYWAVAIPLWFLSAIMIFAAFIYPAINMTLTPNIDDIITIQDQYSHELKQVQPGGVPSVSDIPITEVCRKLYLTGEE